MTDREYENLLDKIECIDTSVNDIKTLLKGDNYGRPGIVAQVNTNTKKIKELSEHKNKITWTVSLLFTILVIVATIITITVKF